MKLSSAFFEPPSLKKLCRRWLICGALDIVVSCENVHYIHTQSQYVRAAVIACTAAAAAANAERERESCSLS